MQDFNQSTRIMGNIRDPLFSGYINYIICPEEKVIPSFETRNYRDIIVDIQKFLRSVIKALIFRW